MVSSAYMRLLIFLLAILIPPCASSSQAFHTIYPACSSNKQGDNTQPHCRGIRTLASGATLSACSSTGSRKEKHSQKMTLGSHGTGPTQRRHDGSTTSDLWLLRKRVGRGAEQRGAAYCRALWAGAVAWSVVGPSVGRELRVGGQNPGWLAAIPC